MEDARFYELSVPKSKYLHQFMLNYNNNVDLALATKLIHNLRRGGDMQDIKGREVGIGDRVEVVGDFYIGNEGPSIGMTGTIVCLCGDQTNVLVEFDSAFPGGHDGFPASDYDVAHCRPGHGWYLCPHEVSVMDDSDESIDISGMDLLGFLVSEGKSIV